MHLIIPFASSVAPACQQHLRALHLPHLARLLPRLVRAEADHADEYTRSPPHERAVVAARGLRLPDGQIPWAAWEAAHAGLAQAGQAWAFVTPCHWRVGTDHIAMGSLDTLDLQEAPSQALCRDLQPWFAQDGIALHYHRPGQWLAQAPVFRGLGTASLDRVVGRNIDAWMPEGPQAAPLRRLQNEMQMLLYHHGVNDARAQRGLPPINSFWISGSGALDGQTGAAAPPLQIDQSLRSAALAEDWAGWARAWQQLDAGACAALLQRMQRGEPVQITLCGERSAQGFGPAQHPPLRRILNVLRPGPAKNITSLLLNL